MAAFAPLFESLLSGIFRQVASDYNLDYKEMMDRYTGKSSFAVYADHDQTQEIEVPVPSPKAKASKTKAPKASKATEAKEPKAKAVEKVRMALSKMKKADLVAELDEQGIDTDGLTVAMLKELVKEARAKEGAPVKSKAKAKSPEASPKKAKKSKKAETPEPSPKKAKKGKKVKAPEPEPEPELEEEGDDEEAVFEEVDYEDFEAKNESDIEARLRAIIAADTEAETSDDEVDPAEEPDSPGGVRAKMLRSQK